jgi:site-specific DNA recombinase
VPKEWLFEDEGHSGASLARPALERLRDLVAGVGVDVVLCYSPDRLARKFAYQALLIEEFTRAGTRVEFVKGPRGDSPEDQLLVQFQGMFAEYEKAQIMERYRRGKAHRARAGSVNVLGGAPFGYRYVRKSPHAPAAYQIVEYEAALVRQLFMRYTDAGATIADLARWLGEQGAITRTGKTRWDRSVVWGMLRNPAYAGQAVFGKTKAINESASVNRVARLAGRTTGRAIKVVDRPREEWVHIPVPAIISEDTFTRAGQRLADNKRFASRNCKVPSLLQGLAACAGCGYAYYRTSTRTTNKKIYYYRCLGSDDYRYEGGRVCANKPVRADYLDQVVWDHITALLTDPALIRAEIDRRLDHARASDPVTAQRARLQTALTQAGAAVTRMIQAYQEQLITIDELRTRIPDLRSRETGLRAQIDALDAQLVDRETYLKLADDLEGFLAGLQQATHTSAVRERQRVLRLLVKDVLVGPEKITIRHRIPVREHTPTGGHDHDAPDTEGDHRARCPLCWGRAHSPLWGAEDRPPNGVLVHHSCAQHRPQQPQHALVADAFLDRLHQLLERDRLEAVGDVRLDHPPAAPPGLIDQHLQGIVRRAFRAEPETARQEIGLEDRLEHDLRRRLHDPVPHRRNGQRTLLGAAGLGDEHPPRRQRPPPPVPQVLGQLVQQPGHPVLLDVGQGGRVDAGCAVVPAHHGPRPPQHVPAEDLVVQRVESTPGIGLGRPVKRMLQGTDRVLRRPRRDHRRGCTGPHRGGTSLFGTHRANP